jgi:hypothetical protein
VPALIRTADTAPDSSIGIIMYRQMEGFDHATW